MVKKNSLAFVQVSEKARILTNTNELSSTSDDGNCSRNDYVPRLHSLIKKRCFPAAMECVVNPESRHEAAMPDPQSPHQLPIVIALRTKNCPLVLIQMILEAYWYEQVMDTLEKSDTDYDPPLVVAIKEGRSIEIIQYLISVSGVRGLREDKNKKNQLPLHIAAEASLEALVALLDADVDYETINAKSNENHSFRNYDSNSMSKNSFRAACQPDISGELPLHCFARHGSSKLASIEKLLLAYPDALSHTDNLGMLPLHHVMKNNASLLTLRCLLAAYPEAARATDINGNLPIFSAFQEGSHTANLAPKIDILLRVYPEAILHTNVKGETLLSMAQKMKKSEMITSWRFNSERLIDTALHRTLDEWVVLRNAKLGNFKKRYKTSSSSTSMKRYGNEEEIEQIGATKKRLRFMNTVEDKKNEMSSTDSIIEERTMILTAFSRVIQRVSETAMKVTPREPNKCYVCWEKPLSHAIVPCGHLALCNDCANIERIIELGGYCPVDNCNNHIFRSQKVSLGIGQQNEPKKSIELQKELFERRCVICLDQKMSRILVPCGHMTLCSDCANMDTLKKLERKCPLGRCTANGYMEIKKDFV